MEVSIKNKDEFGEEFLNLNESSSVTVDMVLFTLGEKESDTLGRKNKEKELKILLVKRNEDSVINKWAIPGGGLAVDESLQKGIQKKIKKLSGIDDIYFEQLYTWGNISTDSEKRVISVSYMALVNSEELKNNVESESIDWFSVKKESIDKQKISNKEVHHKYRVSLVNEERNIIIKYDLVERIKIRAFDREVSYEYSVSDGDDLLAPEHLKIIDYALERMKNKAQYTAIAFSLLPRLFTLTELQQVYEILLGRKLIKSNFRRWVNKFVEETEKTKKDGAHRPSRLFKLKKEAIIDGVINI